MEQKFNLPTETVELPSKGLLYPKDSPLAEGKVEIKYMTAREEDILTNANYIRQGVVIDKLLESLIITPIKYTDLLVGDKDALMMAARILGYGKDYDFTYGGEKVTVDLSTLKPKELDETLVKEKHKNEFEYKLPNTDNVVTFKLLTQKDDKDIDAELEGLKKINKTANNELTTRLKYMILSINGNYERSAVRQFVDTAFLARDSRALREYYTQVSPGVETKVKFQTEFGDEEDINIQFTSNFFWPESGI
tara:strand:- start:764 stop:1513 length:750 start_codon:yes stop_codon:yes gene_type:complete